MMKVEDIYWLARLNVKKCYQRDRVQKFTQQYSNMYAVIQLHYLYSEEMINKPFFSFPKPPFSMTNNVC
jgi:hypothetical protein